MASEKQEWIHVLFGMHPRAMLTHIGDFAEKGIDANGRNRISLSSNF
jgi:hypothetical protein